MIWVIIIIAGLLIYFTMNSMKDGSVAPPKVIGNPDLILAPKSEVITDLDEQMVINHIAGMLENLSNDRVQSVHYKSDKEVQNLVVAFHLNFHRIALDKIEDESLRKKYYVDKDIHGELINSLIQLCSNLVNQKSSFVEIRESLESRLVEIYSEARAQIPVSQKVKGNSVVAPQLSNLTDVVKLIEAEKFFNKGTELFDAGQYEGAVIYFQKAAGLDDKDALYQLGNAYLEGRGVDQNIHVAFDYYLKLANLEHEKAQYNVGLFYLQGKVGERNIDEGIKWIKKSASYGYPDAQKVLQHLKIN